jgi:phosphopantothenoylcysteine decarboxylase/phosphopantothenate--cysteine ligase
VVNFRRMRILITAGPTREPIDPVRYIGNRSSGRAGIAIAESARRAGHDVSLILGPVSVAVPDGYPRTDVQTAEQMRAAVLEQFPSHDLLIMAAAVADYRPKSVRHEKVERGGTLTIELEATEDILAAAGRMKRPNQRTVGFSLVSPTNLQRSVEKLRRKNLDLIVSNPLPTMDADGIEAVFLWPDGRREDRPKLSKAAFGDELIERASALFGRS